PSRIPENSCPITRGMGTERCPLYMWGSVPQTPQWVGRRIAPSRGGGDSGKLSIRSSPGAASTAALIILPPALDGLGPGDDAHSVGRCGLDSPAHPDQVHTPGNHDPDEPAQVGALQEVLGDVALQGTDQAELEQPTGHEPCDERADPDP